MLTLAADPDFQAALRAVVSAGPSATTQAIRRANPGLAAEQVSRAREWLRSGLSFDDLGEPEREDTETRVGLAGRTPEERAESDATARRIRGTFKYIMGETSGNVISSGLLPVLTPGFRFDDLAPKAICTLIRAKYRHVFARRED